MPAVLDDLPADGSVLATTAFPPQATSARRARRFLRDAIGDRFSPELLDTLLLLTTELVSNAVHCTERPCELRISCSDGGMLLVELADTSAALPVLPEPSLEAESGRGLLLLDALADGWGVTRAPRGKAMWFTLQT